MLERGEEVGKEGRGEEAVLELLSLFSLVGSIAPSLELDVACCMFWLNLNPISCLSNFIKALYLH